MSNLPIRRDEVHELNEYRPPSAPSAYKLIRWKPIYDMIVAGHIMGRSNKALAEEFDFTPVHIANILRSDSAQQLIAQAHKKIRETAMDEAEESVDIQSRIQKKALKRVEEFLDREELAEASPFVYMNTISKYTGISSAPVSPVVVNNNIQQNNQTNVSEASINRLAKALEISEGIDE